MKPSAAKRVLSKTSILLLLVGLAGLSALAKHSDYLPKSNPAHYISHAAKMNLEHLSADFAPARVHRVDGLVPPKPERPSVPLVASQKLELPQIGLTVSLQHRSPPPRA